MITLELGDRLLLVLKLILKRFYLHSKGQRSDFRPTTFPKIPFQWGRGKAASNPCRSREIPFYLVPHLWSTWPLTLESRPGSDGTAGDAPFINKTASAPEHLMYKFRIKLIKIDIQNQTHIHFIREYIG